MKHFGKLLTRENVERALEHASREKPKLRKGTHWAILYKGEEFPPKEIARQAIRLDSNLQVSLKNYRTGGGEDELHPAYRVLGFQVVKRRHVKTRLEDEYKRIARLCFNIDEWKHASMPDGKSRNNHEGIYGYGHEEWLFDMEKTIDGYHYGFIEAVRINHDLYVHNTYDVILFTIDGRTGQRFWAGRVTAAEVITSEESNRVKAYYQKKGWLKQMEMEVKKIQASDNRYEKKGWSNYHGLDFFNVRFRHDDLDLTSMNVPIPAGNLLTKASRYEFLYQEAKWLLGYLEDEDQPFLFKSDSRGKNVDKKKRSITYFRPERYVQITALHKQISDGLAEQLKRHYGRTNVRCEHPTFLGREIDIVVRYKGKIIFYEIKTYRDLILSIREAIGQLMEYVHWKSTKRAHHWIIITQPHADTKPASAYLQYLRETYNLPIYLQTFAPDTSSITPLLPALSEKAETANRFYL